MAKKNLTIVTKAAQTDTSTTSNLIELFKQEAGKVIVGRVEPRIYAFKTDYVPNALKVGDTYRPIKVRMDEWERRYPNSTKLYPPILEKSARAKPDDPNDFTYFRDYSVHLFLENNKKYRLQDKDFQPFVYKSNEFFRDTSKEDVEAAIIDIQNAYKTKTRQYQFYTEEGLPEKPQKPPREEKYEPRDIQQDAINNFTNAWRNKRNNLLMYAVMRFGKTFTAMCCAEQMKARVVVIVSAKKDVKDSWYQIVLGHTKFDGYEFFDADNLLSTSNTISKHLRNNEKNKAAIFLTLQDLFGKGSDGNDIKEKHKELFGNDIKIDLLIVDETHFGARAEQYGKVLQDPKYVKDAKKRDKLDEDDFVETSEGDEVVKAFDAKVKLHLSGTPYRILMGSEFEKEDIVAFFQYSDIVAKKKEWDDKNMDEDEWKNPYYGFPEMVRFAFNPNKSAREKLEELRKNGYTYALSALLKPKSVKKDSKNDYQKFENEKEVLDLLKVIDGTKSDDQLFGFLDYDKLKEGKMCRHIVMVLPYKASCDAMQKLINDNKLNFKNLKNYNIINISGVDVNSSKDVPKCSTICSDVKYNIVKDSLVETVRNIITACEQKGQKTLTLTVNRMLTGCTVPEWDTMLYMKDTSSPQEYDQAIFRLQNPYTKTYIHEALDENGKPVHDKNGKPVIKKIKKDMKPQTLLVDFDPMRLFLLQEHKAQIYDVNTGKIGNSSLEGRIAEELRISPLLTIDPIGNIVKVTAANILEKVSQYHYDRGIREEVDEIPIDMGLYKDPVFRETIAKENEIGSKAGLSIPAHEGEGTDTKIETKGDETEENKNGNVTTSQPTNDSQEEKIWEKKLKSYFVKILLYAYLTDDEVNNLQNISEGLDSNDDNRRIAKHLGIEKSVLQILLGNINRLGHCEMISRLDYKIQDINKLSHNKKLSVEKQVEVALCKFGKLGDAMVITPANIADDMVALLPDDLFKTKDIRLLDIAATSGEFAMALYSRMSNLRIKDGIIKKSIYSIPKSSICYELTRKVYKLLGLNIDNIAEKFDAFDLLKIKDKKNKIDYNKIKQLLGQNKKFSEITLGETTIQNENNMIEFNAIVGNPPYQEQIAEKRSLAKQLFPSFIELGIALCPSYLSLITPSRWFTADGQDNSFPKLRDFVKKNNRFSTIHSYSAKSIFPSTDLATVCVSLWNKNHIGDVEFEEHFGTKDILKRPLFENNMKIILPINKQVSILKKVRSNKSFKSLMTISTGRDAFGIVGKNFKNKSRAEAFQGSIEVQCAYEEVRYYDDCKVTKNRNILNSYKIFTSKGNGGAGLISDDKQVAIIGKAYVAGPGTACTDSLIPFGCFDNQTEAVNLQKYFSTKFLRFLVGIMKVSQNLYQNVYEFVPLQDFTSNSKIVWTKNVSEIDKQLYEMYGLSKDEIAFIEAKIKPMP